MAYDRGLADRVRSILERRAGFSERQMFGGIAFMINGHMCCGVMKTDLMLRLAPEAVVSGLRRPHTRLMDFSGKPMKSMMLVDAVAAIQTKRCTNGSNPLLPSLVLCLRRRSRGGNRFARLDRVERRELGRLSVRPSRAIWRD
jgi:hypothetical protein